MAYRTDDPTALSDRTLVKRIQEFRSTMIASERSGRNRPRRRSDASGGF
jgi:hypothetical protein